MRRQEIFLRSLIFFVSYFKRLADTPVNDAKYLESWLYSTLHFRVKKSLMLTPLYTHFKLNVPCFHNFDLLYFYYEGEERNGRLNKMYGY